MRQVLRDGRSKGVAIQEDDGPAGGTKLGGQLSRYGGLPGAGKAGNPEDKPRFCLVYRFGLAPAMVMSMAWEAVRRFRIET
jgi:hypothetical protein